MTRNDFICQVAPLLLSTKNFDADKIKCEACVIQARLLADVLEAAGYATWTDMSEGAGQRVLANRPGQALAPGQNGGGIAQTSVQIVEGQQPAPLPR